MVPKSDHEELEHKNGRFQEERLANTAELALIEAETPQIIANMARLALKPKERLWYYFVIDVPWPGYPPDDMRETIDAISSRNRIR